MTAPLSQSEIRSTLRRRSRVLIAGLTVATLSVLGYLLAVSEFRGVAMEWSASRFGSAGRDVTPILLIAPAFFAFLAPTVFAEKFATRYRIQCPACNEEVTRKAHQLLATGRCPECHKELAGKRSRSPDAYSRWKQARARRAAGVCCWMWPALSVLATVAAIWIPTMMDSCTQMLWVPALTGLCVSGWAWIRTRERRFLLSLAASGAALAVGVLIWARLP